MPDSEGAIPAIELHDFDEATLRVLQSVQRMLLKHPIAFQAAFSALIAEGEAFAATPEGQELKARSSRAHLWCSSCDTFSI